MYLPYYSVHQWSTANSTVKRHDLILTTTSVIEATLSAGFHTLKSSLHTLYTDARSAQSWTYRPRHAAFLINHRLYFKVVSSGIPALDLRHAFRLLGGMEKQRDGDASQSLKQLSANEIDSRKS